MMLNDDKKRRLIIKDGYLPDTDEEKASVKTAMETLERVIGKVGKKKLLKKSTISSAQINLFHLTKIL